MCINHKSEKEEIETCVSTDFKKKKLLPGVNVYSDCM